MTLQTYRIRIKTPLENDFIDFSQVFTRHRTNPRDILKVTSPNYIPTVRHYTNLMSPESLESEAAFLINVNLDRHLSASKQYNDTYRRYCNKALPNFYKNGDIKSTTLQMAEVKYLDYLCKKLEYTNNDCRAVQRKYIAAKFYGQLLDLTNFSDDNEKTNAN